MNIEATRVYQQTRLTRYTKEKIHNTIFDKLRLTGRGQIELVKTCGLASLTKLQTERYIIIYMLPHEPILQLFQKGRSCF